jgi:hypothetical protein
MLQPLILTSADVSSVYVQLTVANVGPSRYGTQLARSDFRALGLHSTEEQIVVSLFMMLM